MYTTQSPSCDEAFRFCALKCQTRKLKLGSTKRVRFCLIWFRKKHSFLRFLCWGNYQCCCSYSRLLIVVGLSFLSYYEYRMALRWTTVLHSREFGLLNVVIYLLITIFAAAYLVYLLSVLSSELNMNYPSDFFGVTKGWFLRSTYFFTLFLQVEATCLRFTHAMSLMHSLASVPFRSFAHSLLIVHSPIHLFTDSSIQCSLSCLPLPLSLPPPLPLSSSIHPFTHSPTVFTCYLIHHSASLMYPSTRDSTVRTLTFNHALIYTVHP